jgi:hypothetical protein
LVGPVAASASDRRTYPLGTSFRMSDSSGGPGNETVVVVGGRVVTVGGIVDTDGPTVVVGTVGLSLPSQPHATISNAQPATRALRINTRATLGHQETSGIHSSGYVDGAKNHDSMA